MNKKILILDYDVGNIESVVKAVKHLGYTSIFSNKKKDLDSASKIILPGQGSYKFAMKKLNELGLVEILKYKVKKEGQPVLGICLGMQILSSKGYEESETEGLNFIEGEVKILKNKPSKLPHIGWNSVNFIENNKIFKNLENNKDFYFIHSYYFECKNKKNSIANTNYNQNFSSIINKENIYGFQFHPEKSLKRGLNLLKNFLDIND